MKVPVHVIAHVDEKAYRQFVRHIETSEEIADVALVHFGNDYQAMFNEFVVKQVQDALDIVGIPTERIEY